LGLLVLAALMARALYTGAGPEIQRPSEPSRRFRKGSAKAKERGALRAPGSSPASRARWAAASPGRVRSSPSSVIVFMMVSREGVELGKAQHRSLSFDAAGRSGEFSVRARGAKGREAVVPLDAPGLLPRGAEALLTGGELVMGDEVQSTRVPVILTLPDLEAPIELTVLDEFGTVVGRGKVQSIGPERRR